MSALLTQKIRGNMQMWLVKKAQRGDADAFVELIEKNKSSLYKAARSYLSCEDDIADVMSETVLAAYEHLGELRTASYFKTWITRILINNCKSLLQSRKRLVMTDEFPEEGAEQDMDSQREFMELVRELPADYRMIFVLYYGEGFHTREIAEILDMSENTVKSRLRRGRVKLEQVVQQ